MPTLYKHWTNIHTHTDTKTEKCYARAVNQRVYMHYFTVLNFVLAARISWRSRSHPSPHSQLTYSHYTHTHTHTLTNSIVSVYITHQHTPCIDGHIAPVSIFHHPQKPNSIPNPNHQSPMSTECIVCIAYSCMEPLTITRGCRWKQLQPRAPHPV